MKRIDLPGRGRDLLQHGLEPFLELAAELGAGHEGAQIERHQALVLEALGHVAIDDALRQPFDDGGLADAGLADQDGIVLGAARQDLDGAANLLVAADDGVELAVARRLGQVARIFLQGLVVVLGRGAMRLASLPQIGDRLFQRLRRDIEPLEDRGGRGSRRQRQGTDNELKDGQKRLLETDNRVVLPVDTTIRVLVTATDVLHAWAVPAFGFKQDAVPGKINESWIRIEREGTYYGQCSDCPARITVICRSPSRPSPRKPSPGGLRKRRPNSPEAGGTAAVTAVASADR